MKTNNKHQKKSSNEMGMMEQGILVKLRALQGGLKLHLALSSRKRAPKGYQSVVENSSLARSIAYAKEGEIISLLDFSVPYKFLVLEVLVIGLQNI
ncbi:hypothetical protein RYH73_07430 [Olivibacter sp. CPCC 100613]|uniref:hypothetical protein n=1 Tax=Olivibacter sp. CPCC 100613 TaxID=3079931 RepID=UPI002FFB1658